MLGFQQRRGAEMEKALFIALIVLLAFSTVRTHLMVRAARRPVFPHITSDTLGIGPRSDGLGQLRCDICHNLKSADRVYVSPGDGFSECSTCSPEIFA